MTGKKNLLVIKFTLLFASSMTIMAGATIAPSLPQMSKVFSYIQNAELIIKLNATLPALSIALLAPFAGLIIDTVGRKKLLIYSTILYIISGTSGLYLGNIYWILAGRAALGIAVAGIMTTSTTLIADYFDGRERRKFMGLQGGFMSFGGVVFLTVGGLLADVHWRLPFAIYGLAIFLLLLIVLYIYEPGIEKEDKPLSIPPEVRSKLDLKNIALIYLIAFLGFIFFFMIPTQMPFVLEKLDDINNTMIGISISISMLVSGMVALNYSRVKNNFSFHNIYVFTFVFLGAGFIIICFSQNYMLYLLGLIVLGVGMGMLMPNSNYWIATLAPLKVRGRLISNLSTAVYLGQFLSPILIRPLSHNFGINNAFGLAGGSMLLIALLVVVLPILSIRKTSGTK